MVCHEHQNNQSPDCSSSGGLGIFHNLQDALQMAEKEAHDSKCVRTPIKESEDRPFFAQHLVPWGTGKTLNTRKPPTPGTVHTPHPHYSYLPYYGPPPRREYSYSERYTIYICKRPCIYPKEGVAWPNQGSTAKETSTPVCSERNTEEPMNFLFRRKVVSHEVTDLGKGKRITLKLECGHMFHIEPTMYFPAVAYCRACADLRGRLRWAWRRVVAFVRYES